MTTQKTHEEMRAELIGKAAADTEFRARLVAEPKAAIKEALGFDLPESVSVQVYEDTATAAHLVLPPSPELTDADLEGVAGGHISRKGFYQDGDYVPHTHGDGRWHSFDANG